MSYSQEIYDAVRSRISGGDVGQAMSDAAAAAAMRARGESVGCNLPPTESEAAP